MNEVLGREDVVEPKSVDDPELVRVELNWEGPFSFKELLLTKEYKEKFKCSGVYLWKTPDSNVVEYVGRASGNPSLWVRQFQHYICLIGGHYHIPAPFTDTGNKWVCNHENSEALDTLFDEMKFNKVTAYGFRYAAAINIYLAKLSFDKVNWVERNLLYDLQPSTTDWGKKTAPDHPIILIHCGTFRPTRNHGV